MSYNILNLPDGSIEGHKYSGGGATALAYMTTLTSSTPWTWTATSDGIFHLYFTKADASWTISILVNNQLAYQHNSIFNPTIGDGYAFVKKGDVIKISTDGGSWLFNARLYLYR